MNWQNLELGSLVSISKGKKHKETSNPKAFRYIQIEDLNGQYTSKFTEEIGTLANEKDLIIVWDGANAGKVGCGFNGMIGSTLARLSLKSSNVETRYLKRYLDYKAELIKSQRTGATIPHVSGEALKKMKVPMPSYDTQTKLADILDIAETICQKDKQSLKKYDELLNSIFYDYFGDIIRNSKGWASETLGKLCLIRRGASPRPISAFEGGNVPWIKIGDGTKGSNIYIEKTAVNITEEGAKKSVYLEPGSLIFANCGVSLGFARILRIGGCIHDGWLSLEKVDESKLNKIFLLKLINSITDHLRRIAPDGTQPNLNTGIMKELIIPVPDITLQEKFEKIVFQIEEIKAIAKKQSDNSESLFRSLVQQAFKGELVK